MIEAFIKAISATPGKPAGSSRATETAAKLIDTTTCIGCKACEVACQEWNNQQVTFGNFEGTYQTLPDLAHNFWNLIKFHETELAGQLRVGNGLDPQIQVGPLIDERGFHKVEQHVQDAGMTPGIACGIDRAGLHQSLPDELPEFRYARGFASKSGGPRRGSQI